MLFDVEKSTFGGKSKSCFVNALALSRRLSVETEEACSEILLGMRDRSRRRTQERERPPVSSEKERKE